MKKYLLMLGAFLLTAGQAALATPLTPDMALSRLQKEARTSAGTRFDVSDLVYTVEENSQPLVYVFSRPGIGYAILGADDIAAPLLGYSDTNQFDADNIPCNMQWWLGEYAAELKAARAAGVKRGNGVVSTARMHIDKPAIAPLVQTKWNQGDPYNLMCPKVTGRLTYTGCVATAMAQVMKQHNWPETGEGSNSYSWNGQTLSMDFSETTFDWDNMTNTYSQDSPEINENAVALLMKACGYSVNMGYGLNGSGAYSNEVVGALIDHFKYGVESTYLTRESFGLYDWESLCYMSLENNCSIYYSGQNTSVGHAFVCDGYRGDGFFHFNWGWGGISDGYFLLTSLDPDSQGVGGSTEGYNINQSITIMVRPRTDQSKPLPILVSARTPSANYTNGKIRMSGRLYNLASGTLKVSFGGMITDAQGNVSYTELGPERTVRSRNMLSSVEMPMPELADGTYRFRLMFKVAGDGDQWHKVYSLDYDPEFTMTVEGGVPTFVSKPEKELPEVTDVELTSPIYADHSFSCKAKVHNPNESEALEQLYAALVYDGEIIAYASPLTIDLQPGETQEFDYVSSFIQAVEPGDYDFCFLAANGGYLYGVSDGIPVQVKEVEGSTTIELTQFTVDNPDNVDPDAVRFNIGIKCNSGYFSNSLMLFLWDKNGSYTGIYGPSPVIFVEKGETKVTTFTHSFSGAEENSDYSVSVQNGSTYLGSVSFHTGESSGVAEIKDDACGLFPNPADSNTILTADSAIKGIEVYAVNGMRCAAPADVNGNVADINVSALPAGTYILRTATEKGVVVKRFIKK